MIDNGKGLLAEARRGAAKLWTVWLSRSGVDLLIVPLVVVVHLALAKWRGVPELLSGIPVDRRAGLYSAAAVVVSLTGTLASVTVAQYLSGRGERMAHLKRTFAGALAKNWRAIFLGSVLAVTLFLAAYAFDSRAEDWHIGTWLFEIGALLAGLRFVRLAVLFGELVELIVLDDTDPLSTSDLTLNSAFFDDEPTVDAARR